MLSSVSDKEKVFAENFSKNSNLDDLGIYLSVFPFRTHLKLHISVIPEMVKKLTTKLDSSKASGSNSILVVVLQNFEPELSYIPAKLLNQCLKDPCFPDCSKVSLMVSVFNVGERSIAKNYHYWGFQLCLIRSMKFLSSEVALYLYESRIQPCMKYYCHVWAGAHSCYLELLN